MDLIEKKMQKNNLYSKLIKSDQVTSKNIKDKSCFVSFPLFKRILSKHMIIEMKEECLIY